MIIYQVKNATLKINDTYALTNFSFSFNEGESVIIYSSFNEGLEILKMLYLEKAITCGSFEYYGDNLLEYNRNDIEEYHVNDVSFLKNSYNLFNDLSIYDNLFLALMINRIEEDKDYIDNLFDILKIKELLNKKPLELNNYEYIKVKIARALMLKPFVLLIDDITESLNEENKEDIMKKLNTINSTFKITLVHQTKYPSLIKYCSKQILIESGVVNES